MANSVIAVCVLVDRLILHSLLTRHAFIAGKVYMMFSRLLILAKVNTRHLIASMMFDHRINSCMCHITRIKLGPPPDCGSSLLIYSLIYASDAFFAEKIQQ